MQWPQQNRNMATSLKSKGRGFARPTSASKLKQVTQASAWPAEQKVFVDGAKCESIVLLKNLAKLLVDRIEAACAARDTLDITSNSQVSNPNKVLNNATDSRLLHGTNTGSFDSADGVESDPSLFITRKENQEVGNSCQSQEYGSNIDVESCLSKEKANSACLSTQKHSGHLGDGRSSQYIKERSRTVKSDDTRLCARGRHNLELESRSCSRGTSLVNHGSSICDTSETFRLDSRPSSQPNPSGSTCDTSEFFGGPDSRPSSRPNQSSNSSRPPTREWTSRPRPGSRGKTGNVASMSSRMLTLKKVNVGLDDCEIPPKKGVNPTPRRKLRSPGLRSLVVPQVKNQNTPPARPPANTKFVLSTSTPMRKPIEGAKVIEEAARKEVKNLESEEVYEAVLADAIPNVFDEVFGAQEKPSHAANKKQPLSSTAQHPAVSRPPHASEEWIIQSQSIKYRAASERREVHNNADIDRRYLKIPREESTSREPSNSTQCSTRSNEDVSCRAPVILPTLTKYHMDKIERYKKCVAEKQLREDRFQQECRPSTAPDPYNVFNVYIERCALQKYSRSTPQKSEHGLDWQVRARREVKKPTLTHQQSSVPGERAPTNSSPARRNIDESSRAMSAEGIPEQKPLQYQPHQGSHIPEVVRPRDKPNNLLQETRGTVNLSHERYDSEYREKNPETKNWTTTQKLFLNGAGESRKNLQEQQVTANSEVVLKKTRFMDHWPFLDRQIEALIQAHILQCCILFKNVPQVFPTLEYQEELQRLYSGHPLST